MTDDLTDTDGRPRVAGKYFEVAGRRFEPRGVTYGTFAPGTHAHPFPEMEQVWRDLESIAAAGFNCIRTYTVPPLWLLDAAESTGLRVLAGIPWEQHVVVLEEPGHAARVRASVAEQVSHCSGHPALFAVSIGNEIPTDIVRWSGRERMEGFLERLYEAAKEADPGGLTTYVNYPSTEYLRLPFLDFHAFNVYLESTPDLSGYVARLHNQVGDLPLVMAELGLDASHHGEDRQAYVLQDQTRAVMQAGCAGLFVFSWTDEWFRGGRPVTGWSFGLTTEGREPKPALEAVRGSLARHPDPPAGGWPTATVVVCAYQAASTITECLEGLARLDYPDFEVLLIDDGSTDGTAGLAEAVVARLAESGGPELPLRIIRTANRGLSRARNLGMDEARGEIVAFLDSDAWPDEQWLRQLAYTFASEEHACVGGPNISPPRRGHVAACVGMAPGGPVHVLETDRLAEHVPGCNMAFRTEALRAVGGFDPQFRVAGDDVDLCWRVQSRGWTVGFSAGAMVWHHPRGSVGAYWRQQVGYGEAEALLEAK
ncbi:MAG: glycosyltransferase, partial [Gemmatimonadota bacterium]|nr:glycosyltransferase [Gemmatimonadota bacterium]